MNNRWRLRLTKNKNIMFSTIAHDDRIEIVACDEKTRSFESVSLISTKNKHKAFGFRKGAKHYATKCRRFD